MSRDDRAGAGAHQTLPAHAKLTVSLRLTGVRDDGYHLIDAEMVSLDLHDVVEIEALPTDDIERGPGPAINVTGPFADFNGTIEEINVDQQKVVVLVNIFGRDTPVELGFADIQKS